MSVYQVQSSDYNRVVAVAASRPGETDGTPAGMPHPAAANPVDPIGESLAWREWAHALADWTRISVIVRTDSYVAYSRLPAADGIVVKVQTMHEELTQDRLILHFAGEEHEDRVAVHVVDPLEETCRLTVVDIDAHGPEDDPDANWAFAKEVLRRAIERGVVARIFDSNGLGGFHIWVFHPRPIPCSESYLFGKWLVHGWDRYGLRKEPESFPSSPALSGKGYGQPIRLPGRHHKRPHFTRVWDGLTGDRGAGFLRGAAAIAAILDTGSRDDRLPASPLVPPDFTLEGKRRTSAIYDRIVDPDTLARDAALAREALHHLGAEYFDNYHRWLKVGMALRQLGDEGLELWHEWSAQSRSRYRPEDLDEKWRTFESATETSRTFVGQRPYLISLGSLFTWARENGWKAAEKPAVSPARGPQRQWKFEMKL